MIAKEFMFMFRKRCVLKTAVGLAVACTALMASAHETKVVAQLMSIDMLGVQRAFFEKFAGTAKFVNGASRTYSVSGCTVNVREASDQSIVWIELSDTSSRCTFNSSKIHLRGPAHELTFAKVSDAGYARRAIESCLEMCGNLADPDYSLLVEAPRVSSHLQYLVKANHNTPSFAAAGRLLSKLKVSYPKAEFSADYVGRSIPLAHYTDLWLKEFHQVQITAIRFGFDLAER